jgi:probable HAF family extracellular repeat protein
MNSRLISLFAAATSLTAGPIYTLADLGTLGGSYAMASAVNNLGEAAGSMVNAQGYSQAFSSAGNLSGTGQANGINDAGQIAGSQYIGGQTYATVWNNGVATTVSGAGSYALAINSGGDVAGMLVDNGMGNAFVTRNGTVIELGAFDGGFWSAAYSLNDWGAAAGTGMTASGNFRAFVWSPSTGYIALGTLGGASSYAASINNSGTVVGSAQTSSGYLEAAEWNGGSIRGLGTLGGVSSDAYGINGLGNVVGTSFTAGNATQDGFLMEGGVMYDINSLLIDDPGWQVTQLFGINDSNQVVGVGILNGVEHAVLLTDPPAPDAATAPEPATWICMAGGLGVIVFFKTRARRSASKQAMDRIRLYSSELETRHFRKASLKASPAS